MKVTEALRSLVFLRRIAIATESLARSSATLAQIETERHKLATRRRNPGPMVVSQFDQRGADIAYLESLVATGQASEDDMALLQRLQTEA